MSKTNSGNFFEDFQLGQVIVHATPRTVTTGDVALYTALYGGRFAVQSSERLRPCHRLSQKPGRRPAGVPHRLRQDRAGHFAQRRGQSRLCRLPLPGSGLSRRHACPRPRRSSASRKIPTARPAWSMSVRAASTSMATRCWNMCAGSWCASAIRNRRRRRKSRRNCRGRWRPTSSATPCPMIDRAQIRSCAGWLAVSLGRLSAGRKASTMSTA